jgi:predicted XRE-type DNA-binding protein
MKIEKRKKLEAAGWKIGTAAEFLNLTKAEEAYVELKLSLAQELEEARQSKHLTQKKLAKLLQTSQPRVAMMVRGDPSVSLDLLVRALLALGVPPRIAH